MKKLMLAVAMVLALVAAPRAHADETHGDSLVTAGTSFKIYPLMCKNGGHIHNMQFVQSSGNKYHRANWAYFKAIGCEVQFKIFTGTLANAFDDASQDTSVIILQDGDIWGPRPVVADSVTATVTGGCTAHAKWGLEWVK